MINDYFGVLDQCLKRGLKDGNWLSCMILKSNQE